MDEAEREKYEAIIADMAKLLELQQKSEGVVIDMIAAAVKAEREACAELCEERKSKYEERASKPEDARNIDPEVARIAKMTCDFNAAAIRARGEA